MGRWSAASDVYKRQVGDGRPPLATVPVEAPLRDPPDGADDVRVVRERQHDDLPVLRRAPQLDVRAIGDGLHAGDGRGWRDTRARTGAAPTGRSARIVRYGPGMSTAASAPSTLTFTDEQQQFIDAIRDFSAREAGTREQRDALTHEGTEQHNQDLYKRFAGLGYVGAAIPEEYGGAGGGVVDLCLLLDETPRGLPPMAGMSVSLIVAGAYERFGTAAQKPDMLGAIARGDVMAIAMSEPEAGSDVGALKCKAVREGDTYRVTGHKTWISAAHVAEPVSYTHLTLPTIYSV